MTCLESSGNEKMKRGKNRKLLRSNLRWMSRRSRAQVTDERNGQRGRMKIMRRGHRSLVGQFQGGNGRHSEVSKGHE